MNINLHITDNTAKISHHVIKICTLHCLSQRLLNKTVHKYFTINPDWAISISLKMVHDHEAAKRLASVRAVFVHLSFIMANNLFI